jgi:hypothetical protein
VTDAAGHEAHQHLVALGIVELELLDGERLAEPLQDCHARLHAREVSAPPVIQTAS